MKTMINQAYWEDRYQANQTGWDAGSITTPLKEYIDQLDNKNLKILIPGAGNGHEFDYLIQSGFTDVTVLDFAAQPLAHIKTRHPQIDAARLRQEDFFKHQGQYDLILEQTFFCALDPQLRPQYVQHMKSLLKAEAKLAGLLFDFPLTQDGPPFGGDRDMYTRLFHPYFNIKILAPSFNSIKPRRGKELFFIFENK